MKNILILAALAFSTCIASAQTLKLKKGQEFNYTTTLDGTMVQSMGGQEMTINMKAYGIQNYVIEDKKGDSYVMLGKVITDSLVLNSAMMDSTFKPGAEMADIVRYEVDKLGKTISKTDARPDSAKKKGGVSMGIDLKPSLPVVPFEKNKVNVGDTWSADRSDSSDFMGGHLIINTKTNYIVSEITKHNGIKCLLIKLTADIANEGKTSMQGMDFFMEGTGKMAGNLYIDAKTGMLVDEELVTENQINLALSGQQSMVIPINQKMTTKRTLK